MQDKINGWEISEIKELIATINSLGQGNINKAFTIHAEKHNRKPTSVRNFYYKLHRLQSENKIKIDNLPCSDTRRFDEKSQQKLLMYLLDDSDNLSIRQKCLNLANFNKSQMLKFQNKYYNLLKNNPKLVEKCVFLLKKAQKPVKNIKINENTNQPNNIITMPITQPKTLTDADINSLFLGLVNLVKENTKQVIKNSVQSKVEFMSSALQKSIAELRKKDIIIKELKQKNEIINNKLSDTQTKLNKEVKNNINNLNTISELANSQKMRKLRDFLQKISKFNPISTKNPLD